MNTSLGNALVVIFALLSMKSAYCQEAMQQDIGSYTLPVQFVKNAGQWAEPIQYKIERSNTSVLCMPDGLLFPYIPSRDPRLRMPGEIPQPDEEALQVRFVSPSPSMHISPEHRTVTQSHYYLSSDSSRWYEHVPNYNRIIYENVWDGVDIAYYENDRKLRQDIYVRDEKALARIRIRTGKGNAFEMVSDNCLSTPIKMNKQENGGVTFSTNDTLPEGGLMLSTEFFFMFGGTGFEDDFSPIEVDELGNFYACGSTQSTDIPLKNSLLPPQSTVDSISTAVLKISCDGKTLLYNTLFCRCGCTTGIRIAVNSEMKAVVLFEANDTASALPITSNASRKNRQPFPSIGIRLGDLHSMILSTEGNILYASFIGEPGERKSLNDVQVDRANNIYISGTVQGQLDWTHHVIIDSTYKIWGNAPGFVPLDSAVCYPGREEFPAKAFILKYSPNLDSLLYGTYIWNTVQSGGGFAGLAIDSKYNIVCALPVIASLEDRISRPLVNPIRQQCQRQGNDMYVLKFNPLNNHISFGTYLGSNFSGSSLGSHSVLQIDSQDNIIVGTVTTNNDIPLMQPMQSQNKGNGDICFFKITPDGSLLKSTYFGTSNHDMLGGIALDPFGNLVFQNVENRINLQDPYPETHRIYSFEKYKENMLRNYITIIDSSWSKVLYSCMYLQNSGIGGGAKENYMEMDQLCYVYTNVNDAGFQIGEEYTGGYFKPWNLILPENMTGWPFMKLRPAIYNWAMPKLRASLSADTVIYSARRNMVAPDIDTITLRLTNIAPVNNAKNMKISISLPQNMTMRPITQLSTVELTNVELGPNQSYEYKWIVRVRATNPMPDSMKIDFTCEYDWDGHETDCPQPITKTTKTLYVIKTLPEIDVECAIDAVDTLTVTPSGTAYKEQAIDVNYMLTNNEQDPVKLGYVELAIDTTVVQCIPTYEWKKAGVTILPGQSYTYTWTLHVPERDYPRDFYYSIATYDTLWFPLTLCDDSLHAPKVIPVTCNGTGPATILYNTETGLATPDTFNLSLQLTNHIDTLVSVSEGRIIYSAFGSILPVQGQPLTFTATLDANGATSSTWLSYLKKPVQEKRTDTIIFEYRTHYDTTRRYCTLYIQIHTQTADAHCTITAPAALTVQDYSYDPNPFDLDYTLENKGTAQLDVASVVITLPADITTSDPLSVAVTPLSPNGKHDLQWNLKALTSAYERSITITVTAYDSENNPVAVCEHYLFLPAITDMTCETQSTAHIIYNKNDRRYEPNPVTASLVVYNHVDTVQTTVEAEIDLTNAPHLKLAAGETNPQSQASLAANASHQFDWKLDVLPADAQVTETVTIRYRSQSHPEWRECTWTYTIDEEAKTYSATCIADGVDSLWLNGTAETIIPNPFQVYYTITNTGTGMLTNCNGTIHLPNHLQLMTGESPTKYYGNIEPGTSVQGSWMVGAEPSVQSLGTHDITFSFKADNLTADVPCEHTVVIAQKTQIDLALSHKKLYFIAKKDAALPVAQQIMVYAGSPTSMPWTAQGYPSWLSVQPTNGNTQTVDIQPNTTAMNLGMYTGAVDFSSSAPNSPKSLSIVYDIVETVGIPEVPAINGITLYQNYPNPFSETTSISFVLESQMQVTLSVYNTLGNLVSSQPIDAQPGMNTVTISSLLPGLYMYVLSTPNGTVSRRMVRK